MRARKRAPPAPWYRVLVATGVVRHQEENSTQTFPLLYVLETASKGSSLLTSLLKKWGAIEKDIMSLDMVRPMLKTKDLPKAFSWRSNHYCCSFAK